MSLISSFVVFLLNSSVRSTTEPVGTGTRIAVPSNFPDKFGHTNPIAEAAEYQWQYMNTADQVFSLFL